MQVRLSIAMIKHDNHMHREGFCNCSIPIGALACSPCPCLRCQQRLHQEVGTLLGPGSRRCSAPMLRKNRWLDCPNIYNIIHSLYFIILHSFAAIVLIVLIMKERLILRMHLTSFRKQKHFGYRKNTIRDLGSLSRL